MLCCWQGDFGRLNRKLKNNSFFVREAGLAYSLSTLAELYKSLLAISMCSCAAPSDVLTVVRSLIVGSLQPAGFGIVNVNY